MEVLALVPTGGSLPTRLLAAEPEAAVALVAEEVSPPCDSIDPHPLRLALTDQTYPGRGATHHRNADDRHTKNIVP